jgi:hypothetical protein
MSALEIDPCAAAGRTEATLSNSATMRRAPDLMSFTRTSMVIGCKVRA